MAHIWHNFWVQGQLHFCKFSRIVLGSMVNNTEHKNNIQNLITKYIPPATLIISTKGRAQGAILIR